MPESFALVRLLNDLFMGVEVKAFQAIGLTQRCGRARRLPAINQALGAGVAGCCGLIAFFIVVRLSLSVEKPNPAQQIAEMIHEFIGGQAEQVIGHGYQQLPGLCDLHLPVCPAQQSDRADSRRHGAHHLDRW